MRSRQSSLLLLVLMGLVCFGGRSTATPSYDVFEVTLTMQANYGDEVNGVPRIGTVRVGNRELINLALGQPLTNAVPTNRVLAILTRCDGPYLELVVYDKTASNVVVSVAEPVEPSAVRALTRAVFAIPLEVKSVGSLEGGLLMASGMATLATNGCVVRLNAKLTGALSVISTDDGTNETAPVVVTNGSLVTRGRPLGQLVLIPY